MSDTQMAVTPTGKLVLQVKQISFFDDRYYRVLLWDDTVVYIASVTTYLQAIPKPRLAHWRGRIGNDEADRVMARAMDKGTRVHAACYSYATKQGVIYDPPYMKGLLEINEQADFLRKQLRAMGKTWITLESQEEMLMVMRFKRWKEILHPVILGAEMTLYSLELDCAGTLDYAVQLKAGEYPVSGQKPLIVPTDGIWIQDLKTGNEDPYYWMQLAAYAKMYAMSTSQKVEGALITYLDTDTRAGIQGTKTVLKTWADLEQDFENFQTVQKMWKMVNPNATPKVFDFPNVLFDGELGEIPNHFVVPNLAESVKEVLPQQEVKAGDAVEVTTPAGDVSQETKAPVEKKKRTKGAADLTNII